MEQLKSKFGNGRALQPTNQLLIGELTEKITSTYNLSIEFKRFHHLDNIRVQELRQKEHSFILNTFGQKYLLFLTYVNFKPYVIYINRKNSTFFVVKTRFSIELYEDTILEGEQVKINNKYYFLVSDCMVYRKRQLMLESFSERYKIICDILENHYVSDNFLEPFELMKKDVFSYRDIQNVKELYIPSLPFTVNGYLFKCETNSSYDLLYIFPENRNSDKSKEVEKDVVQVPKHKEGVSRPKDIVVSRPKENEKKEVGTPRKDPLSELTEATFLMKVTEFPDAYEIYMFNKATNKRAKVGIAGIPNIPTSQMVREWFSKVGEEKELYAKFKKHPINEKWIPQYLVEVD